MKSKDKETQKALTVVELRSELAQLREKQFRLRFKHGATPLTNPMELRSVRKNIARVQTWIRAKELQGN